MNTSSQPYRGTSTLATVSLISGILGFTLLPTIGSIIAIVTGHMAKNEIKKSFGALDGNGLATAGLILGYANIVLILCACIFFLLIPLVTGGLFWQFGDSFIQP